MREYSKQYRKNHREELLLKKKIYRENNREDLRRKQREYLELNREKSYSKVKEWKDNNRLYMKSYLLEYYRNKDNLNRKNELRRKHYYTISVMQKVYENNIKEFGTLTCIYCFTPLLFGKDTIDHLIPIYKNGNNDYENLEIACRVCNSTKGTKTYEEFGNWVITNIHNEKGVLNETAI